MGMAASRQIWRLFINFLCPISLGQEPFPEPLEIMVAKRRVYRCLGDVVPGFMPKDSKKELESIWSPSVNALTKK